MEYTGKKIFKVVNTNFDFDDCRVKVAVDFGFPKVRDFIKEMSCYWSGCPDESAPFEEHLEFFLQILANRAVHIKMADEYNDYGIQQAFNNEDGYYPLDGSQGIAVLETEFPDVDSSNFEIRSVNDYDGVFKLNPPKF